MLIAARREMSKNQALKELKDGYDEHSHTYSETLASLSKELVTFREESMTKTKEGELVSRWLLFGLSNGCLLNNKDLEVHSSALAKIRTALQSVKEDVTSHGNAVEDLQNSMWHAFYNHILH